VPDTDPNDYPPLQDLPPLAELPPLTPLPQLTVPSSLGDAPSAAHVEVFDQPTSVNTDSSAPEIRPGAPVAKPTPSHKPRRIPLMVIALSGLVALCMVMWLAGAIPKGHGWTQIRLDKQMLSIYRILDPGISGIAIIGGLSDSRDYGWEGISLTKRKPLWSLADHWVNAAIAGDGFLAFRVDDRLRVVDAHTGATTGDTILSPNEDLLTIQAGMVFTSDTTTVCARAATNPTNCVWSAAALPTDGVVVFGDGKWADTNSGVIDVATGQPAPFGSDAQIDQPDGRVIYYAGPDQSHIARFACIGQPNSMPPCSFQIWDAQTDLPISPPSAPEATGAAFLACNATTSPTLTTMSFSNDVGSMLVTGYSWATGARQWQTVVPTISACGSLVGNTLIMQGLNTIALNYKTGQLVWSSRMITSAILSNANTVYLSDSKAVTAFDARSDNFAQLRSDQLPELNMQLASAGGRVISVDPFQADIWILRD